MQHYVVVGKALCLPHAVKRIGIEQIAVNGKINVLALFRVILSYIARKPALKPSPFVIVGAAAPARKFVARLKAVHKKIPHKLPAF